MPLIICDDVVMQMETFSALLVFCEGSPPVTGGLPLQKASGAELWCFLWCVPGQTVEQTDEMLVISHHGAHCDVTAMFQYQMA